MSSFMLYAIGFTIFVGGLIWGALALGVPGQWVALSFWPVLGSSPASQTHVAATKQSPPNRGLSLLAGRPSAAFRSQAEA